MFTQVRIEKYSCGSRLGTTGEDWIMLGLCLPQPLNAGFAQVLLFVFTVSFHLGVLAPLPGLSYYSHINEGLLLLGSAQIPQLWTPFSVWMFYKNLST